MEFNRLVFTMVLISSITFNGKDGILNTLDNDSIGDSVVIEELLEEKEIEEEQEIENITEEDAKKEIVKFEIGTLELTQGMASEDILRIKRFFKEKGYENIDENSYYDYRLREIVMEYQRNNSLRVDGIIGKNTYEAINKDMEGNGIIIPQIEVKFLNGDNLKEMIIINKDNNTLYHIKEGHVLNRYPVATGKTPGYTPEGKFIIVNKIVDPAWGGAGRYTPVKGGAPNNPLGRRWMGLNIKGGGVYGIHGNSHKESIGRYISLGCIRMFNGDIEALFNIINVGTPVWIGNEVKLKEYGVKFR